ncbi:MAG: hypothetical protein QOJ02_3185 [Acidobacteriota bacterium]|jgi:hypothetical protein|nr:hypothetical protein [Acidobacteriota bacterium]
MLHKNYVLTSLLLVLLITIAIPQAIAQQEKKPLTNDDVVTMVKAQLPENTIVLAIQQSPTSFDTSVQALIQLKNQGVSAKVLDAMLQVGKPVETSQQTTSTVRQPNSINPLTLGPETGGAVGSIGSVILVDGANRTQMKYSTSNIRSNSMLGAVVNPFHKTRMRAALNGNHARLRIASTSPLFEVSLMSDVNASDIIALVKLDPKSDRREIETSRGGITGVSTGFRKEDIIPISIDEPQNINGTSNKVYTVKAVNPLPPGEYALVVQTGVYYDFGVDANK